MTILGLHGSYGSARNFQVQLAPVIDALQQRGPIDFRWVDGAHLATPPPGYGDYFGHPPHYRFFNYNGMDRASDILEKVRQIPKGQTAADTMRMFDLTVESNHLPSQLTSALDWLYQVLEEHPEVDGIIGYSEGAAVAASFILDELERFEREGRPRQIKYAIFLSGWPPVRVVDGKPKFILPDDTEEMIDIPTCHIVGCNDPYIDGSMVLYEVCDEDTAILFEHGKGHTVPRDAQTLEELARAIEDTRRKGRELFPE